LLQSKTRERELAAGYTADVDAMDELTWYQILEQFDDANIYQTWSYDEVRCGRPNISHLVVRKDGDVVAAAQVRIVKIPLVNLGIAYVRWGPLWRRHRGDVNPETFRQAIRALRNEYACRRGLVVRLYPILFDDGAAWFSAILKEEGFSSCVKESRSRTLLLDLTQPLAALRKGLRPHWHRYLKVAEKNGLVIVEGSDDNLFEMFVEIYKQMIARKRFLEPNDINEFRRIQGRLPDKLKMRVMLCKSGDEVCAGLVCSAIGNTAVYLFGATSDSGLNRRGSYLLHWKLIEWLKQNDFAVYDLNGINPKTNPGTYKFKTDLCGTNGKDVSFLGRFDSWTSVISYAFVASGDGLRGAYRALREKVAARTGPSAAVNEKQMGSENEAVASR
jgi:lipid II:glycine glycyltransferase (peptidoglycan interpeptide bridge formation enzyme)